MHSWWAMTNPKDRSQITLLVVDDDLNVRESTRDLLEIEGYRVETAENGAEALRRMQINRPAMVLLDMIMPVMGGREVLDCMGKDSKFTSTPVLLISATVDQSNSSGAVGFLKKPIDVDELLSMIEQHTTTSSR